MFRSGGLYPNVHRLAHLRGVQRIGKMASGGHYHFLHQKLNMSTDTGQPRVGRGAVGSREGGKGSWKEGGITWRNLVEYGLKGLAAVLLFYAVKDEIALPWYRAYRRGKEPEPHSITEATAKKRATLNDSSETSKAFSGAKCATNPGEGGEQRRSQRYNFLAEAVEKAAPSVVYIEKSEPMDTIFGRQMSVSTGSGFIVSSDGYVLTNAHVVGSARSVNVKLASGKVIKGEVTDLDQVADLALLKLSTGEKLPALEFGSSASLRPGEWVVALGSPLSLSNTITAGIVSSCHRPSKELGLHRGGPDIQYVQTDAPITIGNSGGPLVNLDGEVIGVNTLTAGPGISFAIPSDFAREFVAKANKSTRRPGRFVIGISMLTVTPDLCHILHQRGSLPVELEHGVLVAQVWPSSVAAVAGLRKGDVIVRINGEKVASSHQVYNMVQSGRRLNMEIVRNSSWKTVTITPEKM